MCTYYYIFFVLFFMGLEGAEFKSWMQEGYGDFIMNKQFEDLTFCVECVLCEAEHMLNRIELALSKINNPNHLFMIDVARYLRLFIPEEFGVRGDKIFEQFKQNNRNIEVIKGIIQKERLQFNSIVKEAILKDDCF
jgi:hypothetical protein